ncbi:MAG TPA: sulfatase-like hydrolase/transferase, partial [Armatimonadaceae bacterium]|nr:sulfatase-like hydrolase/transferase [Armatimonadaceae bacterium]
MPPRPNILLIHADQHRYDCLGAHGHPFLKTPNFDRLAREGVDFSHAFTPNPVCSPARACLQTGAWATTHKCVTIPTTEAFQSADPSLPVLTQLVADAGYRVAHVGKFHNEVVGGPTDHGVEEFVPYHAYKKWREDEGLPPQPRANGWFGETDAHISPEQSALGWQADHVLRILEERGAKGDAPFFVRWDPTEPHLPNVVPEPFASLYPPESIPPWPSFPDPLVDKPDAQRRTRLRWGTDAWTWEQWQPVVGRYLGEITLLDAQVGR